MFKLHILIFYSIRIQYTKKSKYILLLLNIQPRSNKHPLSCFDLSVIINAKVRQQCCVVNQKLTGRRDDESANISVHRKMPAGP